ncbi:MAG: hypothetical protein QGF67_13065 [Lentisphaeria bacterium]|nr:hypothetical protein [Lentisphaeria bacterium]MDP7742365.1 hypothetical protein [Lentisphaeria bacterium]
MRTSHTRSHTLALIAVAATIAVSTAFAATLAETFNASPFVGDGGSFTLEGPGAAQFTHLSNAPAFTGDPAGSLEVEYDTLKPSTRLTAPLGVTVAETDSFSFGAVLTIRSAGFFADPDGFAQIAFGLINSTTTGLDRSGDFSDFDNDTFDMVEFNYFPNESAFFGGPFVSPSVLGAQVGTSAFNNIVFSSFAFTLPPDTPLRIEFMYDGVTSIMTGTVDSIAPDGTLTPLAETVPLDIYNPPGAFAVPLQGGFTVDAIAISAYLDGFAFAQASAQATLVYDELFFSTPGSGGTTCAELADQVIGQMCNDLLTSPPTSVAELEKIGDELAVQIISGATIIDDNTPGSASDTACITHVKGLIAGQ